MVLTSESVDETLKCNHLNESFWQTSTFLWHPYDTAQDGCKLILSPLMKCVSVIIQTKGAEQCFPVVLFIFPHFAKYIFSLFQTWVLLKSKSNLSRNQ